jgi:hypothetical protein
MCPGSNRWPAAAGSLHRFDARGWAAGAGGRAGGLPGRQPQRAARCSCAAPPVTRLISACRKWSGGLLLSKTYACKSSAPTYDEKIAADLWDVSAEFAKVPAKPQV